MLDNAWTIFLYRLFKKSFTFIFKSDYRFKLWRLRWQLQNVKIHALQPFLSWFGKIFWGVLLKDERPSLNLQVEATKFLVVVSWHYGMYGVWHIPWLHLKWRYWTWCPIYVFLPCAQCCGSTTTCTRADKWIHGLSFLWVSVLIEGTERPLEYVCTMMQLKVFTKFFFCSSTIQCYNACFRVLNRYLSRCH